MRHASPVLLALSAIALLAACSKPAATTADASSSAATSPPVAAPTGPTEADKKALLATLPAAYQHADLDNGQSKLALCKSCHTLVQGGETEVGPNLWGVFGRKSGSMPGFAYSDGMKALNIVWDADRINTWITNPKAMVPGTKMTYAGMEDPKDRTDLIAYLKIVTSTPAK